MLIYTQTVINIINFKINTSTAQVYCRHILLLMDGYDDASILKVIKKDFLY